MFADTTPPAIAAPCADARPVNLHITTYTRASSPDCRWELASQADDPVSGTQADRYRATVIDKRSHRAIYQFEMERSASAHWLADGKYLIVNYFEGSGSTIPLLFTLKSGPVRKPVDLAALIWPSVLKRAGIPDTRPFGLNRWTYHYYVNFVEDTGDRITISAQPWYTPRGEEGPGTVKCYIYSVSKTTLRYRFMYEVKSGDCPYNPNERRD